MKKFVFRNRFFLVPQALFIVISLVFISFFSKAEIHLFLNQLHTPVFDHFFRLVTYLGNGLFYLVVFLFLMQRKFKFFIVFITAILLSNLLVFVFKQALLPDMYRPSRYFELYETYRLHFVQGVKLHSIRSFPSGHTTTAFTVFLMLATLTKNNATKFSFFMIACLTGYSRIYLSQHFLMDVVAGSIVGSGSIILSFKLYKYYKMPWMRKSLTRLYRKARKKRIPAHEMPAGISLQEITLQKRDLP
ncbi:phosphatase PAP2 family protein [Maribellus sp. CM-23]|uniref:phosphatase PAP2 family protein n=1 Tax=Maribellus sp. CM-23 TaxID=2781026 RepID=UPI001F375E42|nr:phosphatase PAP2 family protein [Maribellus sp. CM-23]MCE4566541.1 phosphatase PAP2 family protein [Maribellus sp. CM-23]